ncbi:MAG: hypothetical protein ACOX60_09705 [Massiliimalia sp.]|jgi:thioredoxin-related protein
MKYKNLMALILMTLLTTTLFSGCGTQDGDSSAQGQTSVPVSQMSQPVSKEDSQTSEFDVLSSIREISPEERELFLKVGDLYAKACTAGENEKDKLYLEGDHIKIYQAEIDYLATVLSGTGQKTEESEKEAVKQMKIEAAFIWAAEQEGITISEEDKLRLGESAIKSYTDPEDEFYPGNRVMLEGSGLSEEKYFDCLRESAEKNYLVNQYADSKFSQWYETWEKTEALQVESWTDGINSTLNVAWEEEQLRIAEEILEKDHAEVKV